MKEQAIQAKVLKFLEAHGFVTCKVITANKAGILDIIACEPTGRYWEIEAKTPVGKASKLQERRVKKVLAAGGVSFVFYGYNDFLVKFNDSTIIKPNSNIPFIN
jgi:hypothetical protein